MILKQPECILHINLLIFFRSKERKIKLNLRDIVSVIIQRPNEANAVSDSESVVSDLLSNLS